MLLVMSSLLAIGPLVGIAELFEAIDKVLPGAYDAVIAVLAFGIAPFTMWL